MSFYPAQIVDMFPALESIAGDVVQPADYNGCADEINAIEDELGLSINGNLPTLHSRLSILMSVTGGLKRFQFGTITSTFATPQLIQFTSGRFTEAPNLLVMSQGGLSAAGNPAIFMCSDISEVHAYIFAYTAAGGRQPSQSITAAWVAYSPIASNATE